MTKISGINEPAIQIVAGDTFFLALTKSGKILGWGDNYYGELGANVKGLQTRPKRIYPELKKVLKIAAGTDNCLALTGDGEVYSWGSNYSSQLGNSNLRSQNGKTPLDKIDLGRQVAVGIAVGNHHSIVLTDKDEIFGWGVNVNGQLGKSPYTTITKPMLLKKPDYLIWPGIFGEGVKIPGFERLEEAIRGKIGEEMVF